MKFLLGVAQNNNSDSSSSGSFNDYQINSMRIAVGSRTGSGGRQQMQNQCKAAQYPEAVALIYRHAFILTIVNILYSIV